MTISTKFYPPLEPVDQPLPDNVILLDTNDNVFDYDRYPACSNIFSILSRMLCTKFV